MYELAKKSREGMKSKARRLAGEPDRKTDSSDWTPASPLNADVKTGMRPIGKAREYKAGGAVAKVRADRKPRKSGGRVEKEIGIGMANKDLKAANEQREGKKHIGGMKSGGALPQPKIAKPTRAPAGHYKHGGKIKKADGGILDTIANALAGKGYIDGSTWLKGEEPMTASDSAPAVNDISPAQAKRELAMGRQNMRAARNDISPAQAKRELAMGRRNLANLKKGGKVKRASGGALPSPEEAMRSEERMKTIRTQKQAPQSFSKEQKQSYEREEGYSAADRAAHKRGGRSGRKHGGAAPNLTVIVADKGGQTASMPAQGRGGVMPVMTPPPAQAVPSASPPAMPPVAAPPPAGMPPLARKSGGRITKVASSYKDMEAGAATGEGRLQKTDIAKKHKDAPARKLGGRAVA